MIHPATLTKEPTSDPDFMSEKTEVWFNEMVYSYNTKNSGWKMCPMMVCPLTDKLMYMPHTSSALTWVEITDEDVLESYMRHLVEKELLGAYETSRQEGSET